MSDIDFQNGFVCGMATKGMIKVANPTNGDFAIAGLLVNNGSRGVWPLVANGSFWIAKQVVSSSTYLLIGGTDGIAYTLSRSASELGLSYTEAVS